MTDLIFFGVEGPDSIILVNLPTQIPIETEKFFLVFLNWNTNMFAFNINRNIASIHVFWYLYAIKLFKLRA